MELNSTPWLFYNILNRCLLMSLLNNSTVCVAIGYGLDGSGLEIRVPISCRAFLLSIWSRPVEGPPSSYPAGTGVPFLRVKAAVA